MLKRSTDPEDGTFAVINTVRKMAQNDLGPIASIHVGPKAESQAQKAAKKLKGGKAVRLSTHRIWSPGDHIDALADVEHRDHHWREHREQRNQAGLAMFQRIWGRR